MRPPVPGIFHEKRAHVRLLALKIRVLVWVLLYGVAAPGAMLCPVAAAGQVPEMPSIASAPTVHARQASGEITIDGKLNELAWIDAEPILLTQQSPLPGKPTPYLTEVRVLVSGDALIFGFNCHDPKPSAINTHTLTRDGDQSGDDTVSVELDSFGDKRTAYYFQINAAAGRVDGLVAGPGNVSLDWDGIWNARTSKTADGWTAEIWIPAQTLGFGGRTTHWGLQLDRSITRDLTELRWASPTLDSDLFDMSRAGVLEVMTPLKQGHGIEIAPYARGEMLHNFLGPDRNWLGAGGGELTWRITPQLASVFTVNTDFAETEVDSRQINITPFPLYFPEKREFFLEGANQYVFGLDLGTTFVPFFSRNIGLLDGYDIPLRGGVKLNGHVGRWSVAGLDVETGSTNVPEIVVSTLGLPSQRVEATNLFASRIAYDVDKHLRVGTMMTHGDPEALVSNTLAGVDAIWQTSTFLKKRSLQLGGWAATTQGDVPLGTRQAWGVRFDYPNDLVNCTAGMGRFGDGFEPLLGFIPRPQTHQTDASCSYRPRPLPSGPFGAIRQASYDLAFSRITDTSGNLQSQIIRFKPVHLTMNSGDSIFLGGYTDHETLTTPFAIVPKVSYPVGSFDFQRYGISITTSPQRVLQFTNDSSVGGYYNGHLYHQTNSLNWTPLHGKAQFGLAADNYFGHTPQGNFVEKLWQFNGALSWSPDLSLSTFVQYDNVSFALSSNTRMRWTFKPGDDFYVIWDRTWIRDVTHPGANLDPDAESITAKIQWTFRL
ncbi:carbohydrate binding family 9 domain-containing protein [Acidicapsa ligni]|uniref:carbohydrate binding family 9 domain-containing protein n=1 Tax=Acidicapsa ligni TaxID=542300 RepID=UPI0021E0119D|nr:carbohydrate binding family 9 domain-containing protein [Acidicapsa ligni]